MKKTITLFISVCCMAAALCSCAEQTNEQNSAATTQASTTETAGTMDANATTETKETNETNDVSSSGKSSLIPSEKLDFYRSGDGVIYQTAYNPALSYLSVNLTQDEDGYHLAMVNGNEYKPEYANCFVTFRDFGEQQTSVIVMEDGTQTESNEIIMHGCPECLCIERMALDGMMTYEFTLYPIKNDPKNTSPKENLEDFSGTLDNYKDHFQEETMPVFLDETQQKIFANATYLMQNINTGIIFDIGSVEDAVKIGDREYYPTGMSYESFVFYTESAFTPAFSAKNVAGCELFRNIRGELYTLDGARGANILYTGRSFELISQSDKEIKFKLIAHCSYKEAISSEEYNAMPENEREFDEEYQFTMEKMPLGWRFSEFNYWL